MPWFGAMLPGLSRSAARHVPHLLLLPLLLLALPARAAEDPGGYEVRLVERALAEEGLMPLSPEAAEGLPVDAIHVVGEDIVGPADPYPALLNWVHVRTRADVVRREVLLEEGAPYSARLAAETERNLRRMFLFAVARVLPVAGAHPGSVGVLVVTKDLWSLRLNSEYRLVGPLLQYVRLRPSEQNLLGRAQQVSLDLGLELDVFRLGAGFTEPRLGGSRLALSTAAAVRFNRASGLPEGVVGSASLSQPLYSLATPWAFSAGASVNLRRTRVFRGGSVLTLPYPDEADALAQVPLQYDVRELAASAGLTRSLGGHVKHDLTVTVGAYGRRYTPPREVVPDPAQAAWLVERYLPRSEEATYVGLGWRTFEASYAVLRDFDTFALSEDVQQGPALHLGLRLAPALLPGTSPFLDAGGEASWRRVLLGDGLVQLRGAASVRWARTVGEGGRAGEGGRPGPTNRRITAEALVGTPMLGPVRLVHRTLLDLNVDSLFERVQLLGGSNGLRGLAPEALEGRRILLHNTELRTRPVEVLTLHAGLALFWDAGTARVGRSPLVHTVGAGVRLLFPQFDVEPLRLDVGWVLNADQPPLGGRISSTFGQLPREHPAFLDRALP